jgi:hypothetical protein
MTFPGKSAVEEEKYAGLGVMTGVRLLYETSRLNLFEYVG